MAVLIIILTCTFLLMMLASFVCISREDDDIPSYDDIIRSEKKEVKKETKKNKLEKYT